MKAIWKEVASLCFYLAIILGCTYLLVNYAGQRTQIEGSSMQATLYNGDQVLVDKLSYRFREPKRFEIIAFPYRYEQDTYYVKRIIGLPEETIQIKDGYVYINDKQLEEDYGKEIIEDSGLAVDKITLKKDEYFVLGDNRNGSIDSRRTDIGAVKREQIKGKAWLCFYPFTKFGTIK